jgi:predicted flap endonuclease-1-like 5' DNA nuclease
MTTPVSKVTGIGPKTAEYLGEKGITTAEALLEKGRDVLLNAPGFSESRVVTVFDAASQLLGAEPAAEEAAPAEKPKKGKKKKDKGKKKKSKKGKKK